MNRKIFCFVILIIIVLITCHICFAEPQGKIKFAYFTRPLYYVRPLVYETLVINENGHTLPCLATSWRWIDDKTLEMKLRRGVTFHDGEPFNAQAVKENFDAFQKFG